MMNYDLMVQLRWIVASGAEKGRQDVRSYDLTGELAYAAFADLDTARAWKRLQGPHLYIVDRFEGTIVS